MTKRQVRFEPKPSATPGFDRAADDGGALAEAVQPVVGTVPLDVGQHAF